MNTFFQQVRDQWMTAVNAVATFYRANRTLVLGGVTVLSILLIVWARLGFTFQIGQFFASEDTCAPAGYQCQGGGSCQGGFEAVSGYSCGPSGGSVVLTCCRSTTATPAPTQTQLAVTTEHRILECIGPNVLTAPVRAGQPANFSASLNCTSLDAEARCGSVNTAWVLNFNDPNAGQNAACGGGSPDISYGGCAKGVSHTYQEPGIYTATLTCFANCESPISCDPFNATRSVQVVVVGSPTPSATATATASPTPTETTPSTPTGPTPTKTPPKTPTPSAIAHTPSVLTVQCGTTQNVLTWTLPAGHDSDGLIRSVDGGDGAFVDMGGSTTITTYTDTNISAGHTYSYRHKAWADTASNTVTCPAATTSPSATPTATPSPTATPTQTPTPTPTAQIAGLGISMSGRNASTGSVESATVQVVGSQQVEVIARIRNTQSTPLNNVVVRATLPAGMAYVNGSTSIGGAPTTIDAITTGGLSLGTVGPGQEVPIVFRANVIGSQFVIGSTQVQVSMLANADGVPQNTGLLGVVITRQAAGQPGTVQTGPGDAVTVALLVSAIMTLLYVSYTHTTAFKQREVESITREHDPLDFRS